MKTLSLLLSFSALTLLPSCSAIRAQQELRKAEIAKAEAEKAKPAPLYGWDNPGIKGKASVKIDLNEQKARIYDNGQEVAWTYVASGVDGRDTPTGTFRISEKKADKSSNIWGIMVDAEGDTTNWNAQNGVSKVPSGGKFVGAPMPHWMRLTDTGIGMHGGNIPDPGEPASHGCIRLPYDMAALMFEALPSGTAVTVTK